MAGEDARDIRHYFVDEAGDPVLFAGRGRILAGTPGCSRFFMLGFVDIADVGDLSSDLRNLRGRLLADPYFEGVPSMDPRYRKTALAFHATDDLAEVRREVFTCLARHKVRFYAVVRDKMRVITYVRQRNERDPEYRYRPDELYDSLVRRLFKEKLHKADAYEITFAKRAKSDRTAALDAALCGARERFKEQWGIAADAPINIRALYARECLGLQAADYFLWALQRIYERGEDRFLRFIWPVCRLIHDVDDTRKARYGAYYTQKRPLTAAVLRHR